MSEVILAGGAGGGSILGGGSGGGISGIPGTGNTAFLGKDFLSIASVYNYNSGWATPIKKISDNVSIPFQFTYSITYGMGGHMDSAGRVFLRLEDPSKLQIYGANAVQFTVSGSTGVSNYMYLMMTATGAQSGSRTIWFANTFTSHQSSSLYIQSNITSDITYTVKLCSNYVLNEFSGFTKAEDFQTFGKWVDDNTVVKYYDLEMSIYSSNSSSRSGTITLKSFKFIKI